MTSREHVVKTLAFDDVNRTCANSDLFMLSAVTARPFELPLFLKHGCMLDVFR